MIWIRNLVLIALLITVSYTDLKRKEIDHWPILLGLAFIIPFGWAGLNNVSFVDSVWGFFLGGTIFAVLTIWGMGGGDVRLMAMIGFFLGWEMTLYTILLSFIIGSAICVMYLFVFKKTLKDHIPFGPAIAIATVLAMLDIFY